MIKAIIKLEENFTDGSLIKRTLDVEIENSSRWRSEHFTISVEEARILRDALTEKLESLTDDKA